MTKVWVRGPASPRSPLRDRKSARLPATTEGVGRNAPKEGVVERGDMRVLISVDMEGIAGVSHSGEVSHGRPDYERFRRRMTEEANQAIAGSFDAGADSVVVNDSHDGMRNVMYECL